MLFFNINVITFMLHSMRGALAWDDPELGIDWKIPVDKILLSDKDWKHPRLRDISCELI